MIKTINVTNGGMIHVFTGEESLGNPDTVNVLIEGNNPVELSDEETQQLLTNISDVFNESQA